MKNMALSNITPCQRREALILLKDFRELQEERIRQYNQLNNSHKIYLETGKQTLGQTYDFETYKTCVKQSTDQFKSISVKVLELSDKLGTIAQLNGNDNGPPVSFIKQIQESEEKKLRLTVDLQLAKQQAQEAPPDEEELHRKNINGISNILNQTTESIRDLMEEIRYFIAEIESVDEEECDSR